MLQNHKITNWKYTLGRVLLFCLCCSTVLIIGSPLTAGLPKLWSNLFLATVASLAILVLTFIFVRWEGLRLNDVGVSPGRQSFSRVVIGFIIGLLLVGLQTGIVLINGHIKFIASSGVTLTSVLLALLFYLIASCREELAYRGYPLRSLNYAIGPWRAQLIVLLIFALEHLAGGNTWIQAFLGAGLGSLLFGIAALKTKGLALPIGLHAAWNFGQWTIGFKNEPGLWQAIIEKGYEGRVERIAYISYVLVMVLAILAFYFFDKRANLNSSESNREQPNQPTATLKKA